MATWLEVEKIMRARRGPVSTVLPAKALGMVPLGVFDQIVRGELPRLPWES